MRKIWLSLLIVIILSQTIYAQPSQEYLLKTLDVLVIEALRAYNSEDYIKFFQYFAKDMATVTTKQYFKAVYITGHKKNLGDFEVKRFIPQESSLDPDFPMLVYEGTFEKYPKVSIKVNFTKEYGNYRITRIRFDKIYPEQEMGK